MPRNRTGGDVSRRRAVRGVCARQEFRFGAVNTAQRRRYRRVVTSCNYYPCNFNGLRMKNTNMGYRRAAGHGHSTDRLHVAPAPMY